jgi:hypothetical protein
MAGSDRSRRAVTRTSVLVTALQCVLLPTLTGCAAVAGPDAGAAADVAERFHAAVAADDGDAACALLAAPAVEELVESEESPCAEAVLAVDLPDAGATVERHASGRQAEVVLDGDTVFLTGSGPDWRVTAAGCTARPERPYECTISGG